eukprot:GHVT01090498.1.p1 GENE.GHVT01090498.1~~GHVT01090498.1.p1  ORF type:complete len:250 (+),score=33.01 GHVT01090498.1:2132-2881(+)
MPNRLSFVDLVSCLRIPFCDGVRLRLVVWLWLDGGEVVIPELPEGVDNAGHAVRGIRDGGRGTGVSSRDANKPCLCGSGKKMKRCCALQQLKQEKERRERKRKLHQAREQREEEEKRLEQSGDRMYKVWRFFRTFWEVLEQEIRGEEDEDFDSDNSEGALSDGDIDRDNRYDISNGENNNTSAAEKNEAGLSQNDEGYDYHGNSAMRADRTGQEKRRRAVQRVLNPYNDAYEDENDEANAGPRGNRYFE